MLVAVVRMLEMAQEPEVVGRKIPLDHSFWVKLKFNQSIYKFLDVS